MMYFTEGALCSLCYEEILDSEEYMGTLFGEWFGDKYPTSIDVQVEVHKALRGVCDKRLEMCFCFDGGEDDLYLCERHLEEVLEELREKKGGRYGDYRPAD